MDDSSEGRYLPSAPHVMPPSARDAAPRISSASDCSDALTAPSTCTLPDRSLSRPISPRQNSAWRCTATSPGAVTSPSRRLVVDAVAAPPAVLHSAATHCATLICAALPAPSLPALTPTASSCATTTSYAAPGVPEDTRVVRNSRSVSSAPPCSSGLRTRPRAAGSALAATAAAAEGCVRTRVAIRRSAADARGRSVSATSDVASSTSALHAPPSNDAPYRAASASSAPSDAALSGRSALRRKDVRSPSTASSTPAAPPSSTAGEAASVPNARTAVRRVISLRRRSSSILSTPGTSAASTSASCATATAVPVMAASFTSWSWSCAARRDRMAANSPGTAPATSAGMGDAGWPTGRSTVITTSATRSASAATL
mmetsp:Transcript_30056/g.76550  ORF Transcript_30056/g.76550 Transcript_30056/m.76550 type:complete len:372 (+) Transcript_30056:523-1638(+)